jgi:pantothenate kinase
MDKIEYKGVAPIPNATLEVIKTGLSQIEANRADIYDANGGSLIDQNTFTADGTGAFKFYCSDRVDIYYNNVLSWEDILIHDSTDYFTFGTPGDVEIINDISAKSLTIKDSGDTAKASWVYDEGADGVKLTFI